MALQLVYLKSSLLITVIVIKLFDFFPGGFGKGNLQHMPSQNLFKFCTLSPKFCGPLNGFLKKRPSFHHNFAIFSLKRIFESTTACVLFFDENTLLQHLLFTRLCVIASALLYVYIELLNLSNFRVSCDKFVISMASGMS